MAAVVGTLITHWPAWWAIVRLSDALGYAPAVAGVEAAVVLVESAAYRLVVPLPWGRATFASLMANAASTGVGLLLYGLGLA